MKKIIALGLVLVIVASISVIAFAGDTGIEPRAEEPSISWDELVNGSLVKGDLNNDKKVTAIDARKALLKAVGSEPTSSKDLKVADFNNDGQITAYDARQILKLAAG